MNSRIGYPISGFQDRHVRPLRHPSVSDIRFKFNCFVGIRIGLAVILVLVFGAITLSQGLEVVQVLMYTAIGGAMGYLLPGIWLGQQMKKRKKNILKSLPDSLDLLCISVEAGLSFDQALGRVSEKWDNELCREFKRMLTDVRLGRARESAEDRKDSRLLSPA